MQGHSQPCFVGPQVSMFVPFASLLGTDVGSSSFGCGVNLIEPHTATVGSCVCISATFDCCIKYYLSLQC